MADEQIDYTPLPRREGKKGRRSPPAARQAAEKAGADAARPVRPKQPAPRPARREPYVRPAARGQGSKRSGKRGSFLRSKGFLILASLAALVVLVGGGLLVELLPPMSTPGGTATQQPQDAFDALAAAGDRAYNTAAELLLADRTAEAQAAFRQAVAYYEQAAALQATDAGLLYTLGVSYLALGRESDAQAIWPVVLQVGSGTYYEDRARALLGAAGADGIFLALVHEGDLYYDQGLRQNDSQAALASFQQAALYYEKALTRNPVDTDVRTDLGTMYRYQGLIAGDQALTNRAIQAWQTALSHAPDKPEALYYLGLGYIDLGQIDQARAMWQRVVEVAPGTALAQDAQSMLDQYADQGPW